MILTPEYVLGMARYNGWQNSQLKACMAELDDKALRKNRKAFFGSILGTANHLLLGDQLWLSHLADFAAPEVGADAGVSLCEDAAAWEIERFRTVSALLAWAEKIGAIDLAGQTSWHSAIVGQDFTRPTAQCVMHMFNHQTHHRGQIHAMLTAAGVNAPVSDYIFMPQEGPWL